MTFSFSIDPKSALPIYAQIERWIRQSVAARILNVGVQLPTVRELAVEIRVNANTVARVYRDLEREGLLETRRGIGTFIARTEKQQTKREREKRIAEIRSDLLARLQREGISLQEFLEQFESIHNKSI